GGCACHEVAEIHEPHGSHSRGDRAVPRPVRSASLGDQEVHRATHREGVPWSLEGTPGYLRL
ncbi:hypothetical protein HK405_005651, partial [Cladochytrium tenue]